MNNILQEARLDFHPKRWISKFSDNSIRYLLIMWVSYHLCGLLLATIVASSQIIILGEEEQYTPFVLSYLLFAGPIEETLFFGIPYYLSGNYYVTLGMGAAISMEGAVILAKCIRDIPNLEKSFEKFEQLRKPRAEKIVKEAQNAGKFVLMKNPIKRRFFKILLSLTLSVSAFKKRQNWIFSYKIDWDEKVK